MSKSNAKREWPTTGNKAFDVILIIILIVSVLGIIAFAYTGINNLLNGQILAAFPCIMYILMYVSIIQYCATYFAKKEQTSLYSMLTNYCMLTLMSTLTLPNIGDDWALLVLAILVVILVPQIGKGIKKVRNSVVLILIVLAIVTVMSVIKCINGYFPIPSNTPFETMVAIFNTFHGLFVWIMFTILYLIRSILYYREHKEQIKKEGLDKVKENAKKELDTFFENEKKAEEEKKAQRKAKVKEKLHIDSKK